MTEQELQRWSREVAADPGAPSFVRLARAFRRQGRREAARDVVLRGLERNPEHVDGHALLALIRVEDGDREGARDEWETVLRLDPANFDASRGLGFLALERGDAEAARHHLTTASATRPDDPAVAQAREFLERRGAARAPDAGANGGSGERPGRRSDPFPPRRPRRSGNPVRLFEPLEGDGPFLGAVVLDDQGLALAGAIQLDGGRGELLGALLSTAVAEARRTTRLLGLGGWSGVLVDCESATLHVSPLDEGAMLVLAADRDAPSGWVVRTAEQARRIAHDYLGAPA